MVWRNGAQRKGEGERTAPKFADFVGKGKRSKGEDSALGKREGNVKRKSSALNLVLNVTFIHASFLTFRQNIFDVLHLPHSNIHYFANTRPNLIFFHFS